MLKYATGILLCIMIVFSPFFVHGHVKWFTNLQPQKESLETILSPLFLLIAVFVAVILAILTQILPKLMALRSFKHIDNKLDCLRKYSRYILKYGTAATLLIQVLSGTIFAPEFQVTSPITLIFIWLTIILLLLPNPFATKAAALLMLSLFIHVTASNSVFHMLDYGFYVAIIGVFLFEKTPYEEWGFPLLYLGTGLSLCWVAVEKWVYPGLSLDIIYVHSVPTFGFTPDIFIILSAFIEFVVGYLLVVGILNRLVAVILTGIFLMTTTLFGGLEIVGHFMIHIILLTFIIEGVSFYKPPIKIHQTKLDQMVFVFLNFIFTLATFLIIYYRFA